MCVSLFGLDRFLFFFIVCITNDDDINQVSKCLVISLSTPLTLLSKQCFQLDISYRSRLGILYVLPITLFDQRITAVLFLQQSILIATVLPFQVIDTAEERPSNGDACRNNVCSRQKPHYLK